LAEQAAQRSTADLVAARAREAQALMDAGMALMVRHGTERRVTVAQIVRASGLSNQAFYRHFSSKDDLVAAIVDAGARRLASYLEHSMAAEATPRDQVRAWVRGVLAQVTDPELAHATRAVNWNGAALAGRADAAARASGAHVWQVLVEPVRAVGSAEPERDAYLIGKLVFAVLYEALWADEPPDDDDLLAVEAFCLAGLTVSGEGDKP
jgi:AcrR family transcriptional regulator